MEEWDKQQQTTPSLSPEEQLAMDSCFHSYQRNISVSAAGSLLLFSGIAWKANKSSLLVRIPLVVLGTTLGGLVGFTLSTRSCLTNLANLPKDSPLKKEAVDMYVFFVANVSHPILVFMLLILRWEYSITSKRINNKGLITNVSRNTNESIHTL